MVSVAPSLPQLLIVSLRQQSSEGLAEQQDWPEPLPSQNTNCFSHPEFYTEDWPWTRQSKSTFHPPQQLYWPHSSSSRSLLFIILLESKHLQSTGGCPCSPWAPPKPTQGPSLTWSNQQEKLQKEYPQLPGLHEWSWRKSCLLEEQPRAWACVWGLRGASAVGNGFTGDWSSNRVQFVHFSMGKSISLGLWLEPCSSKCGPQTSNKGDGRISDPPRPVESESAIFFFLILFPGGLVIQMSRSQFRGLGFNPWPGNKIHMP